MLLGVSAFGCSNNATNGHHNAQSGVATEISIPFIQSVHLSIWLVSVEIQRRRQNEKRDEKALSCCCACVTVCVRSQQNWTMIC